jgi:hypothetical protein
MTTLPTTTPRPAAKPRSRRNPVKPHFSSTRIEGRLSSAARAWPSTGFTPGFGGRGIEDEAVCVRHLAAIREVGAFDMATELRFDDLDLREESATGNMATQSDATVGLTCQPTFSKLCENTQNCCTAGCP